LLIGSSNAISPGGGSSGKRKIVIIRVIKIKSIAIIESKANEGNCMILIKSKKDIIQIIENVIIEKSLAGINCNTGSVISHPFLDSMKAKKLGKKMRIATKMSK
jgi:hypothetical protein